VVELGGLGREIADDIAQAGVACQLRQAQSAELRPTGHLVQFLAFMVLIGQGFKVVSLNKFQQLSEYRIMMCQGLNPPVFTVFVSTSIVPTCCDSGFFLISDLRDSSGDI
jgi:hypothetical protein